MDVKGLATRVRDRIPIPGSRLDRLIAAEIADDPFFRVIERMAASPGVCHLLEIGSSAGEGSTRAFVSGMAAAGEGRTLHCLEVSRIRFAALVRRYEGHRSVLCYNLSSVPLDRFPAPDEVEAFYRGVESPMRHASLRTVLGWLRADVDYLLEHGLSCDGIAHISQKHGIERFDAVLIDGSEFTGKAELEAVYGARFLLLDDIRTYKNHANWTRLRADPNYRLVEASEALRNGYAVFERVP